MAAGPQADPRNRWLRLSQPREVDNMSERSAYKSAITGEFVSDVYAKANPNTTYRHVFGVHPDNVNGEYLTECLNVLGRVHALARSALLGIDDTGGMLSPTQDSLRLIETLVEQYAVRTERQVSYERNSSSGEDTDHAPGDQSGTAAEPGRDLPSAEGRDRPAC